MIAVTGAAGKLGRLVIEDLLGQGMPASEIVAAVRTPRKAADLAARGVMVREADYDRPETLGPALAGTDRILLISGSEVGKRVAQHGAVVDAAAAAGVSLLAYTSILHAEVSGVPLAAEHKATEEFIRARGLAFTFLRTSWYLENYTGTLAGTLERGAILGCARDGRVAAATRADFAAACAAVLTGGEHAGAVYELGGDEPFTLAEFAAEVSRVSGTRVVYRDLPVDEYIAALVAAGVPDGYATALALSDLGIARGELTTDSGDLRRLIGRHTTAPAEAIAAALKG